MYGQKVSLGSCARVAHLRLVSPLQIDPKPATMKVHGSLSLPPSVSNSTHTTLAVDTFLEIVYPHSFLYCFP